MRAYDENHGDFREICRCDIAEASNMSETWCSLVAMFGKLEQVLHPNRVDITAIAASLHLRQN